MEELKLFLNSLSVEEQKAFASRCNTSIGYLRKAITNHQKLGPVLCVKIETETRGSVTRKDLHPDEWRDIWPELLAA